MAKETSSSNSPLPLHEALEAEFVALHGELPQDYPRSSEPETRLRALWTAAHGLKEKRAALCISGGGIRSATFGLGILQGLARCGLLDRFHYLSTVSGGGYIGSWLSAWIKNDPEGIRGVVGELKRRPESTLNPEPQPIRHLREFSNYLAPKTGLTSVDFWTLIATFIRNMFLNWLVLISLFAAAMMVPRLYLAAINLQPDWSDLATWHSFYLSVNKLQPDWSNWVNSVKQPWDKSLTILLVVGVALIAVAMAYAIIDVPSTGNARLPQRRFLLFRQLPLFLASLILAAWWAIFYNVHGDESFRPANWLVKFVGFFVAAYVGGGLLGTVVVLSLPERRRGRFIPSFSRLGTIVLTSAFAGLCLWAMATRMFLDPKNIEFTLKRDCEAIEIPSQQKNRIPAGTQGFIKEIVGGSYTICTDKLCPARIAAKDRGALGDALGPNPVLDPDSKLPQFTLKRDCEAIQIPSGRKVMILRGTNGLIMESVPGSYSVEARIPENDVDTSKPEQPKFRVVRASIAEKDLDALKPEQRKFTLVRKCKAVEIPSQQKIKIQAGTQGVIKQIDEESCTVEIDQGQARDRRQARIARKDFDAFELNPVPAPANDALNYVCFAPALILAMLLLVNFLFTGLTSRVTEDEDREWWGRSAAWILITVVGWIVFNLVVLWGAQAISATPNGLGVFLGEIKANPIAKAILGAFGGVTGIVTALLTLRSKLGKKLGGRIGSQWPLTGAAVLFFVLLAIVISWILLLIGSQRWAIDATTRFLGGYTSGAWRIQLFVVFFLTGVTAVFGALMGLFINPNKFSLHATYRNRLIRGYLAASRTARKPSLFTGFDPDDNFELYKLLPEKPLHVINGTLNLVKGEQLAWQERKAESFTMSRLHCGCWDRRLGYRPSSKYGDGITLGTAMAISGAAANPNMGYHSSPVVGFLMTLFNVRLGWWLGNPGAAGGKTWFREGPRYSVGPLFSEAFGRTTDRYKYVNLSDGGHFENLGIYEMVLRRCHYIVVSDGGEDPECAFADLGEAVRKIRVDFGIPIEFDSMTIYPRSQIDTLEGKRHNCAIGRIRYSVVDGDAAPDGVIVYIKPACYGKEPRDIYEYFKTNPTFPHESTADQFFSESQFESYRMLGAYTMGKLCRDCHGDFRRFIRDILKRHLQTEVPNWLAELLEAQGAENKVV